jgi:membrane protein
MKKVKAFWVLLKKTFREFSSDKGLKLSASLSYYTVFSIAPMLIIIISLAGIFFGMDAVEGRLYIQINGLVGEAAALKIQEIVKSVQISQRSGTGALFGFVVLMIGASGIFAEIQDSINYIWSVKIKRRKEWLKTIFSRLMSFLLIAGIAFLLLLSLLFNAVLAVMSDRLEKLFPHATFSVFYILNLIFIFTAISCLFAIIFKVLPDASIRWKDAFVGAVFTAFLFMGGKFIIGFYLGSFSVGQTYGATASIILILLWVYYSTIILFFGAEFTKVYILEHGRKILPTDNAEVMIKSEN